MAYNNPYDSHNGVALELLTFVISYSAIIYLYGIEDGHKKYNDTRKTQWTVKNFYA